VAPVQEDEAADAAEQEVGAGEGYEAGGSFSWNQRQRPPATSAKQAELLVELAAAATGNSSEAGGLAAKRAHALQCAQQLQLTLARAGGQLLEMSKEGRNDTRKVHTHHKELISVMGATKSMPYGDPQVRRLLAGDTSDAANVSSLRAPVDFFFGRRPPMDARGRQLQSQVIDHRASSFHKRSRQVLLEEVINSVKKMLWNVLKVKFVNDPVRCTHEMARLQNISSAELFDEAELVNIRLANANCKVWQEVGEVMWKTHKKCAQDCRLQFINNDDPRIVLAPDCVPSFAASGKRLVACAKCAARKIKCKHAAAYTTTPGGKCKEGSGEGGAGEGVEEEEKGGGWTKSQAAAMVHLVGEKESWESIANTLKNDFHLHRTAVEVMEYYQRSYNMALSVKGTWSKAEDAILIQVLGVYA